VHPKLEKSGGHRDHIWRLLAHDLRNPIIGILSASEFLLEDLSEAEQEHVTLLEAIHSSSRFMLQLIEEILESSIRPFHFQPSDLVALVKQDLVLNRLVAKRKRVRLDLLTQSHSLQILADRPKLYRVIDKLVTNAIKFSNPDSSVEIRVGAEGGLATLTVQDHGVGIPPEECDAALRPAPIPALAAIAPIIEGHNGHIRLESELGKGSTFTVSLPLSATSKVAIPTQTPVRHLRAVP